MKKLILIFSLLLFCAGLLYSGPITFEGYLEGQYGAVNKADEFDWNMWDSNITFEGRFNTDPVPGTNVFFKFYSDKDNDQYKSGKSALAVLTEGHALFRQEKSGLGFEIHIIHPSREVDTGWMARCWTS
ncbi:MAG: hypothetical protein P9X26_09150 [Candidatus Stygibacter frigidus]|nr:hypothetical protein [Candidatus Stygibacter frigidus]